METKHIWIVLALITAALLKSCGGSDSPAPDLDYLPKLENHRYS
ncbi:hypothetical protein AB4345_05310 [Vibrio breoganii]